MIIRADSERPERNLHFTPPSPELMDAARMVTDTLAGATAFYSDAGDEAMVYVDGGYLVNIYSAPDGTIHTSSREADSGDWETGWTA